MTDNESWREMITVAMNAHGETWKDIVEITLTAVQLDKKFDAGFGGSEGEPFTAWTKNRVYFPAVYDGSEWADSVPRNPNGEPTEHVGGQ